MFKQDQPKRTEVIAYTELLFDDEQQHDDNENRKMDEYTSNTRNYC